MLSQMIKEIKKTLRRYNMIQKGDLVVVGVSGGPDSVCLLSVLNEIKHDFNMELITAHFNHGLRPFEDDAETRFVESLSVSLDLPFVTEKAIPHLWEGKGPLEERARHARYCFFEKVRHSHVAQKIAVGHTLNDQAETVLMRLLRGSGTSGLAGIPPCRDNQIIRPLIAVPRSDVMAYLKKRGLQYMTDSSNAETRFLRNRIRLGLLPELEKIQPRIVERLGQTAEMMKRDDEWLESESEKWVEANSEISQNQEVSFPLSLFKQLPEGMKFRTIRRAVKIIAGTLRRISLRHIEAVNLLAEGAKSQSQVDLPHGVVVKRVYGRMVFQKGQGRGGKVFSYLLDGPGQYELAEIGSTLSLEEIEAKNLPNRYESKWIAFLNADQITYPLTIRNFRAGDRFIPLGMSGHRKVKDFFIDLKVPREERARTPLLTHQGEVLWVCGFRIDNRFRVTADTKKVLKVTIFSDQEPGISNQ